MIYSVKGVSHKPWYPVGASACGILKNFPIHAPYFAFMLYDIIWVSNVCITCQPSGVAGCQWDAQRLVTASSMLVFCLLRQAFFSRLTGDNCPWCISNTAHELAKITDLHWVSSIQKYFFSSLTYLLTQPPSTPSTVIHDGAKGVYDWSGKFVHLIANKKSSENGQILYGQGHFYKYRICSDEWLFRIKHCFSINIEVLHVLYVCIGFI